MVGVRCPAHSCPLHGRAAARLHIAAALLQKCLQAPLAGPRQAAVVPAAKRVLRLGELALVQHPRADQRVQRAWRQRQRGRRGGEASMELVHGKRGAGAVAATGSAAAAAWHPAAPSQQVSAPNAVPGWPALPQQRRQAHPPSCCGLCRPSTGRAARCWPPVRPLDTPAGTGRPEPLGWPAWPPLWRRARRRRRPAGQMPAACPSARRPSSLARRRTAGRWRRQHGGGRGTAATLPSRRRRHCRAAAAAAAAGREELTPPLTRGDQALAPARCPGFRAAQAVWATTEASALCSRNASSKPCSRGAANDREEKRRSPTP